MSLPLNRVVFMLAAGVLLLCAGCTTPFKPAGPKEEKFYSSSRKDIGPQKFSEDPNTYKDQLLAWTGIIKKFEMNGLSEKADQVSLKFEIEHRHFSWQYKTRPALPPAWFVSPKGEGNYSAEIVLKKPAPEFLEQFRKEMAQQFAVSNFIIIYGKPEKRSDGSLFMNSPYASTVDSAGYTDSGW